MIEYGVRGGGRTTSARFMYMSEGDHSQFTRRYGPWALVLGGSDGLGRAWTLACAERGLNVAIVGRRKDLLSQTASDVRSQYDVQTREVAVDLSIFDAPSKIEQSVADIEIGLVIYNAALSPIGDFTEIDNGEILAVLQTNCVTPTLIVRHFLTEMRRRRKGGLVIVSSLAGFRGSKGLGVYSASKSYLRTLSETLWVEAKGSGVDVITTTPGAITTPGFNSVSSKSVPGQMSGEQVAVLTLQQLGRGPVFVPGSTNRLASALLTRLLPTKWAIALMGRSSQSVRQDT